MIEGAQIPAKGVMMALDISKKSIGVAFCDFDRILASPYETIRRSRWADDLRRLINLAEARNVATIVIGLPLNMDGSQGPAAQSRRDSATRIQHAMPKIPIMMQDERLTTQAVADAFDEGRWRRPKQRADVDHFAAAIILEDAMRAIANSIPEQKE